MSDVLWIIIYLLLIGALAWLAFYTISYVDIPERYSLLTKIAVAAITVAVIVLLVADFLGYWSWS